MFKYKCRSLYARKLVSRVCEQQRRRPACASGQPDYRFFYLHIGKYRFSTGYVRSFNFLVSLCSWGDWFEFRFVGNPEDRCLIIHYLSYTYKWYDFWTVCFLAIWYRTPDHQIPYHYPLETRLTSVTCFATALRKVRGVIRKFAEKSCHFYIVWSLRARITAHNTATHMQLMGYNMLDVSRLRAVQLSSRQRYIAWTGPFYIGFWRFTTQPSKLQRFVKKFYAVIAHIAFHAYLTTYSLLFYANFQRFISNEWCSKSKGITVLSKKAKHSNSMNPLPFLACHFFKIIYLHSLKKTPLFRTVDLILIVKSDIVIIMLNADKKISFLFKIYKNSKNWRILGLPRGWNLLIWIHSAAE